MAIKYLDAKRIRGVTQALPVKDAQANTHTSSSGTTLTNSSFTVASNSNRILIVCAFRYSSGGDISGITWNGSEAFTRAKFQDGSTETGRTEIWYLVNPTATTASVVTTWDASTTRRGAGVYSFYNVKQTSPIGVTADDDGTATVTTSTITPTTAGSMIVDVIGSGSNGAPVDTLTAGWTQLIGGDDRIHSSQYNLTPTISSANNMFWTFVSAKGVNWIAVEVKAFASVDEKATLITSGYKAATFDGSNDKAGTSTISQALGNDWAFCGWIYNTNAGSSEQIFETIGHAIYFSRHSSNKLRVEGSGLQIYSTNTMSANTWYHVVFNCVSNAVTLYIDGVAVNDTGAGSYDNSTSTGTVTKIWVGAEGSGNQMYWTGSFCDLAVFTRNLTTAEITSLSGGTKVSSISQTSLLANWTFDSDFTSSVNTSTMNLTLTSTPTAGNSVGTSPTATDEKTAITDVPTGTRYEETDTRKIFRRKGATTLTFGDDFTSSGSTSHTSNNSTVGDWTTNDYADVKVDGTNDYLSFSIHENATSERISYDLQNSNALGSGNNASSNFVCRGEIYWSSITISNNLLMYIEVSDVGYSASTQTNLVGIGFYPYGGYIRVREATSGTAQNDVQPSFTHSTSTTFFWEIIKNGTAYTCTIRSGSHTGTTLATGTGATGDHTNLRYIRIRNRGGDNESGVFNGYIDNIKFYNGVTSVDTASWAEKGTA